MIKQYVNLPEDEDQNFGRRVNLEVETAQVSAEDVVRAEWWVEPDGDQNQDQKYLSRFARASLSRSITRNRDDKFTNRLSLPHVGGEKYIVKCSKPDDRENFVALETIETWRKLYYTVHYMNDECRSFFNDLKTRFEDVYKESFIELEKVAESATLVDEEHTVSSNSLNHLYRSNPVLADRPFHLRLVILNNIYEAENNTYIVNSGDADRQLMMLAADTIFLTTDNGLVPGRPIRSVHARSREDRQWINITRHVEVIGDSEIKIPLFESSRINALLLDNHEIQVRVRTRERDEYLGHSIGNFCCLRINESGTPEQRKITVLQTLTHEVGHGCQQVVRRERIYDASGGASGWENNPMWHTDNFGGQGPHCATNAAKQASSDTTSGQVFAWAAGTLCTMFFQDDEHVDSGGGFCDQCKPRLTRVNLGEREMRRQGWGNY